MPAIAGHPYFEAGNLSHDPRKAAKTRCHAASKTGPKKSAKSLADHAILLAAPSPVPRLDGFLLFGVAGRSRPASARALAAQVRLRSSHWPAAYPNKAPAKFSVDLRSR